jgi:hypothetical protein
LISCSPKLRIDIRAEKRNFTPKGDELPESKALFVQFYPGGTVPDHAKDLVERLPGFTQGVSRDENPYESRIGWWDSVAAQADYDWSDEDREYVEEKILRIGDPNIMVVEEVKVEAPYEKYLQHRKTQGKRTLEHVIADITQTYEVAGFNVEQAVSFEKQNGKDQKVIDALYALVADAPETETEELIRA